MTAFVAGPASNRSLRPANETIAVASRKSGWSAGPSSASTVRSPPESGSAAGRRRKRSTSTPSRSSASANPLAPSGPVRKVDRRRSRSGSRRPRVPRAATPMASAASTATPRASSTRGRTPLPLGGAAQGAIVVGSAGRTAVDVPVQGAYQPREPLPLGGREPGLPGILARGFPRPPPHRAQRVEPEDERLERQAQRLPVAPRPGRLVRGADVPGRIAAERGDRPRDLRPFPPGGGADRLLEHVGGMDQDRHQHGDEREHEPLEQGRVGEAAGGEPVSQALPPSPHGHQGVGL